MNTKLLNIKCLISLFLVLFPFSYLMAQYNDLDSLGRYETGWAKLIPTHAKVQFAGSMGLFSLGTGWDYGKNNQWETDVLFGYLPKYSTDKTKITFTLKQNFMPWRKDVGKDFSVEPLACGLYVNSILDGDFWVNEPDKYPNNYYAFSTKMRFNIYLGQRLIYNIKSSRQKNLRSLTFFYEISSCDLYIVSAFTNRYIKPKDYLGLSFGLKAQFF